MSLKAIEYPDIWVFSEEHAAPPLDYPTSNRVSVFLEFFLLPAFFGRIVLWGGHRKFMYKVFKIDRNTKYRIIDGPLEANELRYFLASKSESGHLSVLFVPQSVDVFRKSIIDEGHYGTPQQIEIGTGGEGDPLIPKYGPDIRFLESSIFSEGERIFCFSHDAQFLYEIIR